MMKRAGIAALVLAVMAVAAFPLSAGELQGPRIYLKEPKFDLGKVSRGIQAEHMFEIRNAGDEVLEIQKVQPT